MNCSCAINPIFPELKIVFPKPDVVIESYVDPRAICGLAAERFLYRLHRRAVEAGPKKMLRR